MRGHGPGATRRGSRTDVGPGRGRRRTMSSRHVGRTRHPSAARDCRLLAAVARCAAGDPARRPVVRTVVPARCTALTRGPAALTRDRSGRTRIRLRLSHQATLPVRGSRFPRFGRTSSLAQALLRAHRDIRTRDRVPRSVARGAHGVGSRKTRWLRPVPAALCSPRPRMSYGPVPVGGCLYP